jgi:hypothetical protein
MVTERRCTDCRETKPLTCDNFYKRRADPTGYDWRCIPCERTRARPPRTFQKEQRKRLIKQLADFKRQKGCAICGESEPLLLHFHHKDPKTKKGAVSSLVSKSSQAAVWAEVTKCAVLCRDCHGRLHAGILPRKGTNVEINADDLVRQAAYAAAQEQQESHFNADEEEERLSSLIRQSFREALDQLTSGTETGADYRPEYCEHPGTEPGEECKYCGAEIEEEYEEDEDYPHEPEEIAAVTGTY